MDFIFNLLNSPLVKKVFFLAGLVDAGVLAMASPNTVAYHYAAVLAGLLATHGVVSTGHSVIDNNAQS